MHSKEGGDDLWEPLAAGGTAGIAWGLLYLPMIRAGAAKTFLSSRGLPGSLPREVMLIAQKTSQGRDSSFGVLGLA